MTLKKTIAGYFDANKKFVEQRDVDMHILEETAIRDEWTVNDHFKTLPMAPTKDDEINMLVEHGPQGHAVVAQKRQEWQALKANIEQAGQPLIDKWKSSHQAWVDHHQLCVANGHDPDTFPGDARLTLKMPT